MSKSNITFLHWSFDPVFTSVISEFNSLIVERNQLLNQLNLLSRGTHKSLIIVDSDDAEVHDLGFQQELRNIGFSSAYFTVNSALPYECDFLINPSILALHQTYETSPQTTRLFGPGYFIFGEQFRDIKKLSVHKQVDTIFINFGSADPMGYTLKVLRSFIERPELKGFNLKVVLGPMSQGLEEIKDMAEKAQQDIEVYFNISNMRELMNDCQLAICSPGTTFWELAVLGIRSLILSSAPREKESSNVLAEQGYASLLLHYDEEFTETRSEQLSHYLNDTASVAPNLVDLQKVIDTNGLKRIAEHILQ